MKTLTIEFPDTVNISEQEAKSLLAARLYENGTLSLGQAADLAGYTKRTFMELLSKYDVSIFNYPATDIENDVVNAQSYHI
jgi:predicted HTH domain antitoxin